MVRAVSASLDSTAASRPVDQLAVDPAKKKASKFVPASECPTLPRFEEAEQTGWSIRESEHIENCRHCLRTARFLKDARTGAVDAGPPLSEFGDDPEIIRLIAKAQAKAGKKAKQSGLASLSMIALVGTLAGILKTARLTYGGMGAAKIALHAAFATLLFLTAPIHNHWSKWGGDELGGDRVRIVGSTPVKEHSYKVTARAEIELRADTEYAEPDWKEEAVAKSQSEILSRYSDFEHFDESWKREYAAAERWRWGNGEVRLDADPIDPVAFSSAYIAFSGTYTTKGIALGTVDLTNTPTTTIAKVITATPEPQSLALIALAFLMLPSVLARNRRRG
jgi:hypothetical protein